MRLLLPFPSFGFVEAITSLFVFILILVYLSSQERSDSVKHPNHLKKDETEKGQRALILSEDKHSKFTVQCLTILASTGMIPGKSWGDMNLEQRDIWRTSMCDMVIEEYGKEQCPLILKEHKASTPAHLPLEARKEWDQLVCAKAGTGWSKATAKATVKVKRESVASSLPRGGDSPGEDVNFDKPKRFPRNISIYEPIPPWPKNGKRKHVNIVLWNQFHGFFLWHTSEYGKAVRDKCSTDCIISTNRQRASTADAIIIHGKTHRNGDFPKLSGKTKLIFASLEQPGYVPNMNSPKYMAKFDYYLTYQLDSLVPLTAVETEWFIWEFYQPPPPMSEKKYFASVFAGNCRNAGADKRTKYIRDLMNLVEVHSYAKCENNRDEFKELGIKNDKQMDRKTRKHNVMRKHKFYLAFENSNVFDYTSEKVFEALRAGTLPVYRGSSSIDMLLPDPNSIINANEMTPAELAAFLKKVASDEDLYNSYFEWKKRPVEPKFVRVMEHCAHNYTSMCHICHKLSEMQ